MARLQHKPRSELAEALSELRHHILLHGLPECDTELNDFEQQKDSLNSDKRKVERTFRGTVWLLLMQLPRVKTQCYRDLLRDWPGIDKRAYEKIRGDTFRTLPTDTLFKATVPEQRLIRVLCAIHRSVSQRTLTNDSVAVGYAQGMNLIAAPFLAMLPELDAFFAVSIFLRQWVPTYWVTVPGHAMPGVHAGVQLAWNTLEKCDPELFKALKKRKLPPNLYFYPFINSCMMCCPPFREALKLFDFVLAFGPQTIPLCAVALAVIYRKELMGASNPTKVMGANSFPRLEAGRVIRLVVQFLQHYAKDEELKLLAGHATNLQCCAKILRKRSLRDRQPSYWADYVACTELLALEPKAEVARRLPSIQESPP
ncbi:MAG: hypothetical protein MHM6MM_000425 [Cercozoa sp. M6MM]